MDLKLIRWLCILGSFISVRSQRTWGNGGYNTGFSSSWTPNQNTGIWGSNPQNQPIIGNQFNSPYATNTNRRPIEQQSFASSGNINSGWYSNKPNGETSGSFNSRKPDEKKTEAIMNLPNTNTDTFSTSDNTPWGSNNQISGSTNQNSKPNNNLNSNRPNSISSGQGNSWSSNKPSGQNSNGLNSNKPSGNEVSVDSDYEDNSVYSWNSNKKEKNKPGRNKWETTTTKPVKSTKKPQMVSSSNNWNQNGKTQEESNTQSEKKTVDTSILDELDKNDWYFGKESNYPKPPFKSPLNIDVSELWNFDRNRKSNKNSNGGKNRGSNNNRRNRQTGDEIRRVQCECVNVNLCDEEDMIVAQEDIKYDLRPLEAFRCESLTEVCCTNPKPRFSNRANFKEQSENRLLCGQRRIRKNRLSGRISEPGEFPWNLQLQNSETNCSASLIHPQLALTAAHCVTNFQIGELNLKAGTWNSNNEPPQMRKVSRVIPHPAYSSQNPRNDIALLVMEDGFELTDNVNTICLPVTNDKWDSNQCLVAGWRLEEVNGEVVEVLEKEAVDFIPQPECQNILLVTDLWRNYILHDSFVCGREKTGSNNSCLGNEGGPVMCLSKKQPDTYLQIGLVSEGMNCDNFGRPAIFTNVLKFLDWINKNHFDLGLSFDLDIRSF